MGHLDRHPDLHSEQEPSPAVDALIDEAPSRSARKRSRALETHAGAAAPRCEIIRVAVVDDHAAVRLGLSSALAARPGFVCVGVLGDGELIEALLYRSRPDVVVLDYELPGVNGLELCRRIKQDPLAPAVVLYSAYVDPTLTVPALVAGVDGMVHKASPARELFEAIRVVAEGGKCVPPVIPELARATSAALEAEDRRLLDLLVQGLASNEAAAALGVTVAELADRVRRLLEQLQQPIGAGVFIG